MRKKLTVPVILSLLLLGNCCRAGESVYSSTGPMVQNDTNSVEALLARLGQSTEKLRYFQGQVEYRFVQPLLESQSLRKGTLYYAKSDQGSKLRINFDTLKQDDGKEQKYAEHYIFDGVWLTRIDYQVKTIERRQLAEPNKPVEPFDLVSRNLPIIGFTKIENLKKQFDVQMVQPVKDEGDSFFHLHLKVRPDSIYKDDYISIDFWIDKKLNLPMRVVAVSADPEPPDGEIHEVKFFKPQVNKKIDEKIFELTIPDGFSKPEVIPLQRENNKR